LGFVGAGGLGQELEQSMAMFAGGEVATMLLAFVVLVGLADTLSRLLRRQLEAA
jgi:phosphonate transport system permease protein